MSLRDSFSYHHEDCTFQPENIPLINKWISQVFQSENKSFVAVNYIFCSDAYLYDMNVKYLNHDTLTDVITFSYSKTPVEGDVFISIDRIKDNAEKYGVSFTKELHRVMVHGVLHLIGYNDKTPEEQEIMTSLENKYLSTLDLA